ncbi:MAG: septum formation initiator family protein [Alphaproteobacteria bacterium]|jgi:cell division protein FtsB|nr:septum formation initiator family protein [Alphaproteobacteria bacterium]
MVVKRRFRGIFLPLVLYVASGAAAFFFVNEARTGSRGIDTRNALLAEISRLSGDRDRLQSERISIEHRNAMLSSASLDPDLLEERARLILNRGRPTDVVIALTP